MRSIAVGIIAAVLMTASGFAKVIITAEDYAVDSDVVLESAVKEVKSLPSDTANVIGDVIKYVKDETQTAAKGAAAVFKKDAHAKAQRDGELAVEDAWDSANNIRFRSYKVNEDMGDLLTADTTDLTSPSIDVRAFFKGIDFSKDTSADYLPKFQSLFVRQTLPNLLAVEQRLSEYQQEQKNLMGHQVEIETKFVEVGQSTLNELGFAWQFGSKDGGDLRLLEDFFLPVGEEIFASGLRTASMALGGAPAAGLLSIGSSAGESLQWDMLISALEQSDDSDVLSAPRVVTRDGSPAIIQVGEDRMIPKSFEINNQDTSPYVQHADWELELMGVYMEVTPEIRDDGLIDLELHPKVVDFIGYDSYKITPDYVFTHGPSDSAMRGSESPLFPTLSQYALNLPVKMITYPTGLWMDEWGNEFTNSESKSIIPEVTASLPYLRIRELETKVTVADGNTIGMGGLIYDKLETFRDKVPILGSIPFIGRLFRSEGERSVKRNLMIFVTATQVDVDGRRSIDLALKK